MVGSNKILTVSYGTFSCTLEGFEDSFGTMKAIAEYFRDLAANDRYFGAEPPVLDTEMLARIAENGVGRRVEAQMDASGITLRTGAAIPAAAAAIMQAAQVPMESPVDSLVETAVAAPAPVNPEPEVSQTTQLPATADADGDVTGLEAEVFGDDISALLAASGPVTAFDPVPVAAEAPAMVAAPAMPPPAVPPVMAPASFAPQVEETVPEDSDAEDLWTPVAPAFAAAAFVPQAEPVVIPAHPDANSVAAKLQRIRAVVGRSSDSVAPMQFADEPADLAAPANTPAAPAQVYEDVTDMLARMPDISDAAQTEVEAEPMAVEDGTPADAGKAFDLASLTAALADEIPAPDLAEPETLRDPAPADEPDLTAEVATQSVAPVRARVIKMRRAQFEQAVQDGTLEQAEALAPVAQEDDTAETAMQAPVEMDPMDDLAALIDLEDLDALRALDGVADQADADLADFDLADADLADVDLADDLDLSGATPDDSVTGGLSADDEAALMEELAAVERETLAALALSDLETMSEVSDELNITLAADIAGDSAEGDDMPELSPDEIAFDEAAIAALFDRSDDPAFEFVAPTAEPAADEMDDTTLVEAGVEDAPPEPDDAEQAITTRAGRALLDREPEADAEVMEHILSQTDAELSSPENSRRREAIAQLKAAVAATEAARQLGDVPEPEPVDENAANAFREDLAQVVRPRRLAADDKPETRSERPRPAPLKLVASQRIDIPVAPPARAPALPVRPRRVSLPVDDMAPASPIRPAVQDAGSFAEFAESMGAKSLPDLLEAAAAYTSFIEGVEDFSRPQLMKKLQGMVADDFSREDGLRSFGTLLRQGRIVRSSNGRFQVNEESRFNPERRAG